MKLVLIGVAVLAWAPSIHAYRGVDEVQRRIGSSASYWQQRLTPTPPYETTTTSTTTTTSVWSSSWSSRSSLRAYPSANDIISTIVADTAGQCGLRRSAYLPHLPYRKSAPRVPRHRRWRRRRRQGRIVWADDNESTMGARPAPRGSFPWLASLFVLLDSNEALFMCAATLISSNMLLTAAHCFTTNSRPETWFARLADNYILREDPNELTLRVERIIIHHLFEPLRLDVPRSSQTHADGRHDIALIVLEHKNIGFGPDVLPACLPSSKLNLKSLSSKHCEIAGWGMTEYNNSASYPDSIRAARIRVGRVPSGYCDYIYKRNVVATGKFCAGNGRVDACQEDSGGPLVCDIDNNNYVVVGIVSSGKGCGVYPGLYTEVSRYVDWIAYWMQRITTLT